uniref:uncharacterized protein LOC124066300 n=1 Tax=Scatophagus argus TaxID=75038 RepID=UPI001ED7D806|nr:uncharacterized protein LOC124066300 [Scatophagus argus]
MMEKEFFKDSTNSWVAPLPFRNPRRRLPNNREYAMSRFKSLRRTLDKRPEMKSHFTEFMQKIFHNHHAELAPPLQEGKECWYLPSFGIYHPQKPGQIRVVFDSSAQYDGVSLNDVLLSGPDLNNSLLGVLMRFRKDPVAITADIQQMFHCFLVREDCRDFLRFLWHRDNDLSKEVIDFRMRVHVFGNSPSPAVATYGLRGAAREEEREYDNEVRQFVERDFYVDDALKSFPTEEEAVTVLQQAQKMLTVSNLRLHKVASNRAKVMDAFPVEDRAKDIQNLDLAVDELPDQRSLGGRLLLRELSTQASEWDLPLPESMCGEWMKWRDSLQELKELHVPRTYSTMAPSKALHTELCVFSDASVKAISAVAYLKVTDHNGHTEVGFVLGKARLAPQSELTIPRLELCAAVLAVEIAEIIVEEIDLKLDSVRFYTDSKVVLGYIHNQSKRFYVFVSNRVQRIRKSTQPQQWHYVPTEQNPADHGSRSVPASKLHSTTWLTGPSFLHRPPKQLLDGPEAFELIDPDSDMEIRPEVKALSTIVSESYLGTKRLERFSNWKVLIKAVAHLHHIAHCFTQPAGVGNCVGWHICSKGASKDVLERAENIIFRDMQHDAYSEELKCITAKRDLPSHSSLLKLKPSIDSSGLLRVGGRINQTGFEVRETNPLIIPGSHHVTTLLIRHHHERVQHQGRHFTEGAIRESGLWIVGGKRRISSIIRKCVMCRKLRDVFGPWEVTTRRTRGGQANSKRWAVLSTCMCTRAVHIEVIEEMSSSSFINALRRFFAIRGPAKQLRSDRGTNFIGACRELKLDTSEQIKVQGYLEDQRCTWIFNPPHSSHMGGTWERMIGVTRRILDSMLLQSGSHIVGPSG